ncbi:MAG: DUF3105 domain-containing protein [Actinomycetota bacterium]
MADEPTSKKLLEKQQRRAAEEERRRQQQRAARKRNLVTLLIAAVIAALVVVLVMQNRESTDVAAQGVDERQAGCTAIEEHSEEGAQHVEVEPDYQTNPPTSGDHLQTPAQSGFFDEPVRAGALVHNMEHGQVVFWYDPDAPQETIDLIEAVVEQEPIATLAVPWEDPEEPYTFAMTAWTASQKCRQVSQAVVDAFRERFQGRGPENIPGIEPFES